MTLLSKILKPRLSIFALNEDGLYSDLKTKKLIYELKGENPTISKNGLNVFFVNGNKPERIVKAIKNKKFEGTLFRGKRNVWGISNISG